MMNRVCEIILLVSVIIVLAEAFSPIATQVTQRVSQMDQKEVERLRKMFRESHKLAMETMDELSILKLLGHSFKVHGSASVGDNGNAEEDKHKLTVHHDGKSGDSRYHISTKDKPMRRPGDDTTGSKQADQAEEDIVVEQVQGTRDGTSHADSNARQSSLFSGFKLPSSPAFANTFSGASPFLSNLAQPPTLPTLPKLPTLPTLPVITPKPPKPPKSSIISNNNGGPMALTNDNVVVVNVLSNNY